MKGQCWQDRQTDVRKEGGEGSRASEKRLPLGKWERAALAASFFKTFFNVEHF